MSSYKFNGLDNNVKKFNVFELTDIHTMNFDRLAVSAAVACNKSDVRCGTKYSRMDQVKFVEDSL